MARIIVAAGAQMGPIARNEPREEVVSRLCALLRRAAAFGATFVSFPELALTTFFPRWLLTSGEADAFFETAMPSPVVQPLFDEARRLGIGFYLGYAESSIEGRQERPDHGRPPVAGHARGFNTSILVDAHGRIAGKYRKVHLPGFVEPQSDRALQHLEKRYFLPGDLGFPVFDAFGAKIGMCICNDRRWPETYRVLALQGAEMIVLGYNTPAGYSPDPKQSMLSDFHNHLVMQAGAYQNASWVIGVAKAGCEEGSNLIGGSAIIAPTGEIVAMTRTLGDEIIVAECDLDAAVAYRKDMFDFARHRRPDQYGIICRGAD
jgi:predicted amidohydrolase